jgi:hypothetical protein
MELPFPVKRLIKFISHARINIAVYRVIWGQELQEFSSWRMGRPLPTIGCKHFILEALTSMREF